MQRRWSAHRCSCRSEGMELTHNRGSPRATTHVGAAEMRADEETGADGKRQREREGRGQSGRTAERRGGAMDGQLQPQQPPPLLPVSFPSRTTHSRASGETQRR